MKNTNNFIQSNDSMKDVFIKLTKFKEDIINKLVSKNKFLKVKREILKYLNSLDIKMNPAYIDNLEHITHVFNEIIMLNKDKCYFI